MKINPKENILKGSFILTKKGVELDDISKRINELISNYLIKIKTDETGWDTLFKDPSDNRFWELVYANSDMQGGGPPILRYISIHDANIKYELQ